MKARLPGSSRDATPDPPPQAFPDSVPPARRTCKFLFLVAGLAVVGVGIWYATRTRDEAPDPPYPPDITDPDVKRVVEAARGKVLADPKSADAWGRYGLVLLANLFDQESRVSLEQAARLDPGNGDWPYALALIALKRQPEVAPDLLRQAARAERATAEIRAVANLTLAETLLERGDPDAAAEILAREAAHDPNHPRILFGLGMVAVARGDDATAQKYLTAVSKYAQCAKQANAQLARMARARGDVAAAVEHERRANETAADPPWPDPILDNILDLQAGKRGLERRIARLEQDGRFAEAAQLYLDRLNEARTPEFLTGAGVNLARLKDFDQALRLLREAVELGPNDSQANYTLGLVLYTQAEIEVSYRPDSPRARESFRETVRYCRKAAELKPDFANAYLFWGLALKQLGEVASAVEPLRKGLVADPNHFELNLTLGQVLAATGNRAEARTYLGNALRIKGSDPRPAEELARLEP